MKRNRKPRARNRSAIGQSSIAECRESLPVKAASTDITLPADWHVHPETRALADSIREDLMRQHSPANKTEIDLIAGWAQARAEFVEIEKARQIRIGQERTTAAERFERRAADAFDRDKFAWIKDPAGRVRLLASSFLGSKFLAAIWQRVLEELQAGRALPFALIREAVMALGSPWQADRATGEGLKLLVLYVRSAPDPEHASDIWAKESNVLDGPAFARDRIRHLLENAPPAADARNELITLARREAGQRQSTAGALRTAFEAARAFAPHGAVGLGLGDATLEKELRLLNRYARQARDRAERLHREFEKLLRSRDGNNRRDARKPPRTATPKPEIDEDLRLLFGDYAEHAVANGFRLNAFRREPSENHPPGAEKPCEAEPPAAEPASTQQPANSSQRISSEIVASPSRDAVIAPAGTHSGRNPGLADQRMPASTNPDELYERHLRLLERYLSG